MNEERRWRLIEIAVAGLFAVLVALIVAQGLRGYRFQVAPSADGSPWILDRKRGLLYTSSRGREPGRAVGKAVSSEPKK